DTKALDGKRGLVGAVGDFGPHVLQSLLVFTTVLLAFGYSKAKNALSPISNRVAGLPPVWSLLAAHCAAMSAFALVSLRLFGGAAGLSENLVALAWLAAGICGIAT